MYIEAEPELPDYGRPITIAHLIHHTSGLRDWGAVAGLHGWPRGTRIHTHAHVFDIASRQKELNFTRDGNGKVSGFTFGLGRVRALRFERR